MTSSAQPPESFEQQVLDRLDRLQQSDEQRKKDFDELREKFSRLSEDVERFNDRFSNYQQSTQWVVQLAFTLIASATITIIITTVLN